MQVDSTAGRQFDDLADTTCLFRAARTGTHENLDQVVQHLTYILFRGNNDDLRRGCGKGILFGLKPRTLVSQLFE